MILSLENERKKLEREKPNVSTKKTIVKVKVEEEFYYLYIHYLTNGIKDIKDKDYTYSEFEKLVFSYDEKKGFKQTKKINKFIFNPKFFKELKTEKLTEEELSNFYMFLTTYNYSTEDKIKFFLDNQLEFISSTNNSIGENYMLAKDKELENLNYNSYFLYQVIFYQDKRIKELSNCIKQDVEDIYIKQLSQLIKIDYKPSIVICYNNPSTLIRDFICLMRLNEKYSLYVHYNQNEEGVIPSVYLVKDFEDNKFWFTAEKVFSESEITEKMNYLSSLFFN